MTASVSVQLFDQSAEQASLTSIQALWWDVAEPKDIASAPVFSTTTAETDASGNLTIPLSASILNDGEFGFLLLYKLDATDHRDSLVFAGKLAITGDPASYLSTEDGSYLITESGDYIILEQ